MKLLLVEDDPDQLYLRSLLLKHCGFECFEASTISSALQVAADQTPRCAMIDLRLPTEEAGLELIRKLRGWDPQLWIVVLTGTDPARFRNLPEAALVDDLLTKPVHSAEMVAKLNAIPPRSSGHGA
ncbi:MAG TPA: response regulator [Bryobacteraceae bacterium]|jgi:DNA-binding response OmpR family regulator|nr:response regulator [Bryobacteraceae bacterium]